MRIESKGIILIYVLWFMAFVSFLIMFIATGMYIHRVNLSRISSGYISLLEMYAIMDMVLTELRNKLSISTKPILIAKTSKTLSYNGRRYTVFAEPEDAKISINIYSHSVLENLFILLGMEKAKAKSIAGNIVIERDVKGVRFLSIIQIKKYMEEKDYRIVKNYLTVVPMPVNINYADMLVLEAIGFTKDEANLIIKKREEKGYILEEDINTLFGGSKQILYSTSKLIPEYFKITVITEGVFPKWTLSCLLNKTGWVLDCGQNI